MTNPMDTSEGEESSGTKPDFIGRVVYSDPDETYEGWSINEEFREDGATYFEAPYEIEVLAVQDEDGEWESRDWKNQRETQVKVSSNWRSKWMVVLAHLEQSSGGGSLVDSGIIDLNDGLDEQLRDISEWLEGRVFHFTEVGWDDHEVIPYRGTEKDFYYDTLFASSDNPPGPLIVPVEEITDEDFLMDLGEESSGDEVEEVDLDV